MQISGEQHNKLVAAGDLYSINGRWYIALDVLDVGFGPALNLKHQPEPLTDTEHAAITEALEARQERRHGRKADLEGSASSS